MFKNPFLLLSLTFVLIFVGCSSLVDSTRESLFGEEKKKASSKQNKWVSKTKYDALLAKYKNLEEQMNSSKEQSKDKKKFDQLNELASTPSSMDTVDMDTPIVESEGSTSLPSTSMNYGVDQVNKQLDLYNKAIALAQNGKTDEAIKIFQFLERESSIQIQVRSKIEIGKLYMGKGQYDLGLQVFESVIRKNAFSGRVLEALNNAIKCSAKLGLEQKKIKYQSMLKDVFEVEV